MLLTDYHGHSCSLAQQILASCHTLKQQAEVWLRGEVSLELRDLKKVRSGGGKGEMGVEGWSASYEQVS